MTKKTWLAGGALLAVALAPAAARGLHQDGEPGFAGRGAALEVDLGPENSQAKHPGAYVIAGDPDDGGQLNVAPAARRG
ncbi:hypothetical protein [Dactylosporangium sp. NPDC049140]|uniref:hypothetical protein n=1 Tax=Dactylosporangium sp. NPDC049140 TaxID=3155647 RepID=UPI0033C974A0